MFISKMAIERRTFLRGVGATIALPLLDAMVPALTPIVRTAARPTPRIGFIYHPMGTIYDQWTPKSEGTAYEMSRILTPLEPFRQHMLVVSGLCHNEGGSKGDGSYPHPRASAVWLSGVHAAAVTQVGAEVRLAPTADQIAAGTLGRDTSVGSLGMELEPPAVFNCEGGTCIFSNTLSWKNVTTPVPMEAQPRAVFERLFGEGGSVDQRREEAKWRASILDSVADDAARLQSKLGSGDRQRLNEYLESVRDVERRISLTEQQGATTFELPDRPVDVPAEWEDRARIMFDLQTLAFRGDVTRVFALMMGRELSSHVFRNLGQSEQHHIITHNRHDPGLIEQKVQIDIYHMMMLRYFLEKLKSTPDGDGTLLDNSIIAYGSAMGDGNQHNFVDIPTLVFGTGGGVLKTGRHIRRQDVPMTNLLLALLDKVGVPVDKLGDSTGKLDIETL